MPVLTTIVILFLVLETANVAALYFRPGSDKFNALGVFSAWEASKRDPEVHDLVRYLVWWVAGTKLIFIALLATVLVLGDEQLKVVAVGALILAIASFFWRLFPLLRQIDARGQLESPGYSKTLGIMIAVFMATLLVGLVSGFLAL